MVRKEDVVSWFKELESYKRIDAMCTLLNMCLPFELRFIGAFLEDLGKRDFQELRGAELRANSGPELMADVGAGAASDPRTRRKMALYVSLLRSCNFACATTLYEVMMSLEQSGLLVTLNGDMLEEILLLYTMALHHPAFTFDQKTHVGDILDKLKPEERPICVKSVSPTSDCVVHTPNLSVPPPSLPPLPGPVSGLYVKSTPLQGTSTNEPVSDINSPGVPLPNPAISMLSDVHHPPPPPGLTMPHFSEYMVTQPPWVGPGLIVSTLNPPLEVMSYPPRTASSPLVSSPADSRPGSPRGLRRPSRDRASPPPPPDITSVASVIPAFDSLTVSEMRRMDDDRLREMGVPTNVVTQLRSVEKLNGVLRRPPLSQPPPGPGRSSGSDSGSSAASSPPDTPAPRRAPPPAPPHPSGPYSYLAYPRGFPGYPPHPAHNYRPPPPPFANGEPFPPAGPYAGYAPLMYPSPAPKLSCWNCGGSGHAGHDCKEPSMEEMTRAGGFQLDFGSAPPDPGDK